MRRKNLLLTSVLVLSLTVCSQLAACGKSGNESVENNSITVTPEPTGELPTAEPTLEPIAEPTVEPTLEPTATPTVKPTETLQEL